MISLARYGALLQVREMRLTIAASVIGRLPIAVTGLAILLLVQTATDSFSEGGAATACYVIGLAAVAPALIIQSMLVAKAARPEHITEAFTWSTSALLSGVGIGVAAGGGLLEYFRSPAVLAAGAATALIAAVAASVIRRD